MATCTRPPALTPISKVACAVNFDQTVGFLFQRKQAAPPFATEAAMKTLAAWEVFLAASDDTTIVRTPDVVDFVIPSPEPRFEGENSNSSVDGKGYFTGFNSVKPTGNFIGLPTDVYNQLRLLIDESQPGLDPGLTVMFLLSDGRIVHAGLEGFDVENWFVAAPGTEGYGAKNKSPFGFTLSPTWAEKMAVLTPSFNARRLLSAA